MFSSPKPLFIKQISAVKPKQIGQNEKPSVVYVFLIPPCQPLPLLPGSIHMDSTGLPTSICPCQSVRLPPFFSAYLFFCRSHFSPVCASKIDQLLTALCSEYYSSLTHLYVLHWTKKIAGLKVAPDSRLSLPAFTGIYFVGHSSKFRGLNWDYLLWTGPRLFGCPLIGSINNQACV